FQSKKKEKTMTNNISEYINKVKENPESIPFADTIAVIESNYNFTPTAFQNGKLQNKADENNGSCKIFSFAKTNQLSKEVTLALFGKFYFEDVLQNPEGNDHQNIRNFMVFGWDGIVFDGNALELK
ncbi:MAG: hypothetical protein ACI9XR_002348, partial [Flavobacterium sp.]